MTKATVASKRMLLGKRDKTRPKGRDGDGNPSGRDALIPGQKWKPKRKVGKK
jgi:hypothetical protein